MLRKYLIAGWLGCAALAAQVPADRCGGPMSALLPECQGGIGGPDAAAARAAAAAARAQSEQPAVQGAPAAGRAAAPAPEPAAEGEPPTEFQRFAAASAGRLLPIFGADLFRQVPSTFAPVDRVPVTADYTIGPGDEILLRVWGQISIDTALTVDRSGAVYLPQAGNLNVAGLEFRQLPSYLRSQLERVFRNFDLNVNLGQLRSIQVFVVGQARRPGVYTVSALSTLVNALFASGGPSAQGSMRRIQLKRGVELETEFDLYDLLLRGDKVRDRRLLPGDVVYVPPAGPRVAVAGSVKRPAVYELKNERELAELLQLAGGLAVTADGRRAALERIREHRGREVVDVPLDAAGLRTPVGDGDVLRFLDLNPRFENAVTLRGNVADPGRFPWRAGMRLRDLIPAKEALLTRGYWDKRNQLGGASAAPASGSVPVGAPEINWSYAVIERQDPGDLAAQLIPFHPGKLLLDGDESENLELRPGDVVTIFSQSDIRVAAAQQNRFVRLEGEFARAGIYRVRGGETLGPLIQRAGGLSSQAYLFGAELYRESARRSQQQRLDQFVQELEAEVERAAGSRAAANLSGEELLASDAQLASQRRLVARLRNVRATGRIVLRLDPGSDNLSRVAALALEDGDVLVVPPRMATVNVIGAVYNQNAFLHDSDLGVGDYVKQAGGFTRNADKRRLFVIRADGSVLPRYGRALGLFGPDFAEEPLHPGDSIVVPEVFFRGAFLRGLRDWSQVFSSFALGAAAINILR